MPLDQMRGHMDVPPMQQAPGGMPHMPMMPGATEGTNLLSILINIAFGFVGGLMIFFGPMPVITYGSKLATDLLAMTGQGAQMTAYGSIANFAPYVVLAPIGGMVIKELSSVRSIKGFLYFAAAVGVGVAIAFFTQGYFATLIK